ncbi:MAG TPA: SDR family oxidoreductase [Gammaproteobacteria bacterium]
MNLRLDGKIAVITAAGAGIGRATASAYRQAGADVWATDINAEALVSLKTEHPDINISVLDVTDGNAIADFARSFEGIDILFNCAGYVPGGGILECEENEWDFAFNINVKSCYLMCKAFIPGMLAKGSGSIINMSSVASSIKGVPNRFCYGATKAAVIGITKAIAAEYAGRGIRCNAICPGTVDTPSLRERLSKFDNPEQARKEFIARQPMGRLGTPEEIAALALYLASDASAYTTGAEHIIDGGWTV